MQADHTWIIPPMRTADVIANEKWIVWLNSLDPGWRSLIYRHEIWYFEAFSNGLMTTDEILEEVRSEHYVTA